MSTERKPVNCRCGRKAEMYYKSGSKFVRCTRTTIYNGSEEHLCWFGPDRTTPAAAVKVWNKVMGENQ